MTHRDDPYFYLSPLKLEIVMETPVKIYLYHSVLPFKSINLIKDYTELMVRKQLIKITLSYYKLFNLIAI